MRGRYVEALDPGPLPLRSIHTAISDEQLYGGVDLPATLATGNVVRAAGILAEPAVLRLPMAERCPAGLAARLSQALDSGRHALVALDEGVEPDEGLPGALVDRLGLFVTLEGIGWGAAATSGAHLPSTTQLEAARRRLGGVGIDPEATEALTIVAARLGVASLRAVVLATRCARASAALSGRNRVEDADLQTAVALVLAHRATTDPVEEQGDDREAPERQPEEAPADRDAAGSDTLHDLLLEAAQAAVPAHLLDRLAAGRAGRAASGASGSGARRRGNRRGRPLPPRPGRPDGQNRIDLVATLRAAVPWQRVRGPGAGGGLSIRAGDLRVRRFEEMSDRLVIFVVDASGSAAFARLAEAKGAIELLLGEAYSRRDHVALVAFRGQGAEILLPPTRSLVQTKRRLAGLPGGGGTPLAAGLRAALDLGLLARGRGLTPSLALLTDGRANIALDGGADRRAAADDAEALAGLVRSEGVAGLVIDTGRRPTESLRRLADIMGAPYLPLPRADPGRLSLAVSDALGG